MNRRIDEFLTGSQRAKQVTNLSLGDGREVSIWENSHDAVQYTATKGHAFSLYLNGGTGTRRVDGKGQRGAPGALCIFPEGHSSTWHITEAFRFMHLYVADEVLRGAFASIHDKDCRRLDISERTLVSPGDFEQPLRQMARASYDGDIVAADVGFSTMVAALSDQPIVLTGGLSQKTLRDVIDWTYANLDTPIRLRDLAQIAGLSDFHFHRMFRKTCGLSPHHWLVKVRVERAKKLLATSSIAQVSSLCGFSSQSHFARTFKQQLGATPGQYRKLIAS